MLGLPSGRVEGQMKGSATDCSRRVGKAVLGGVIWTAMRACGDAFGFLGGGPGWDGWGWAGGEVGRLGSCVVCGAVGEFPLRA